MKTIDDAWHWYVTTKRNGELIKRLARLHWEELPWEGTLGRDEIFKPLDAQRLRIDSEFALEHLDDLAVLVLFSVFEGTVRDHILREVKVEAEVLRHRVLIAALAQAIQDTREESFFRVLEPFKEANAPLVELVNQVRRYRNWVAHGRRWDKPGNLSPEKAYDRLTTFLGTFGMNASQQVGDSHEIA